MHRPKALECYEEGARDIVFEMMRAVAVKEVHVLIHEDLAAGGRIIGNLSAVHLAGPALVSPSTTDAPRKKNPTPLSPDEGLRTAHLRRR